MDIAEMPQDPKTNDRAFLLAIDTYNLYVFTGLLKSKNAQEVERVFLSFVKNQNDNIYPDEINVDYGKVN